MLGTRITRRLAAIGTVGIAAAVIGGLLSGASVGGRAPAAQASAIPRSISADSSVDDVLRFAEASGSHWRTLSAEGRTRSGGSERPFKVSATRSGRSRVEDGDELRVRNGKTRMRADRRTGAVQRGSLNALTPRQEQALQDRMAAHRANDPTLMREGEAIVDTPVNSLISPANLVRKELRLTATSVKKVGTATIAGREAVVLEARFPAELAKEDHWDVYVDARTGILLGLVIEPLEGGDRYESFVDTLAVDPVLPDALFDCESAPVPAS
jgi:hypothetical protein